MTGPTIMSHELHVPPLIILFDIFFIMLFTLNIITLHREGHTFLSSLFYSTPFLIPPILLIMCIELYQKYSRETEEEVLD